MMGRWSVLAGAPAPYLPRPSLGHAWHAPYRDATARIARHHWVS